AKEICREKLSTALIEKISNAVVDELRSVAVSRFIRSRYGLDYLLKIFDDMKIRIFSDARSAKETDEKPVAA
ncbi:MAG: hypothetical protein KDJ29_11915, partial [Hyphomicrobiales bacterium]|nr:hypothetical protein [Hyphomicrobiales bacterium]